MKFELNQLWAKRFATIHFWLGALALLAMVGLFIGHLVTGSNDEAIPFILLSVFSTGNLLLFYLYRWLDEEGLVK